jgi:hypothetical protein
MCCGLAFAAPGSIWSPAFNQQFLKPAPGEARARVIPPDLFDQLLLAMADPVAGRW